MLLKASFRKSIYCSVKRVNLVSNNTLRSWNDAELKRRGRILLNKVTFLHFSIQEFMRSLLHCCVFGGRIPQWRSRTCFEASFGTSLTHKVFGPVS